MHSVGELAPGKHSGRFLLGVAAHILCQLSYTGTLVSNKYSPVSALSGIKAPHSYPSWRIAKGSPVLPSQIR